MLYTSYNNWRARLAQLGKSQQNLIDALAVRGHKAKQSALSQWISGAKRPSNPSIIAEIEFIIIKWEREYGKKNCIESPQSTEGQG